jgi:hypothetical protein
VILDWWHLLILLGAFAVRSAIQEIGKILTLRHALRGTVPTQRAAILRALALLWSDKPLIKVRPKSRR